MKAALAVAKPGNSWPASAPITFFIWIAAACFADRSAWVFALALFFPCLMIYSHWCCCFPVPRRALFLSSYHTNLHLPWYGDILCYLGVITLTWLRFHQPVIATVQGLAMLSDAGIMRVWARKYKFVRAA